MSGLDLPITLVSRPLHPMVAGRHHFSWSFGLPVTRFSILSEFNRGVSQTPSVDTGPQQGLDFPMKRVALYGKE